VHAVGPLHKWLEAIDVAWSVTTGGAVLSSLLEGAIDGVTGLVAGAGALGMVTLVKRIRTRFTKAPPPRV